MREANRKKRLQVMLCMLLLLFLPVFGLRQAGAASSKLEVHFIDVGQGDSILVSCGGHHMMIDFGNNDKGTKVQYHLQKQGVETLDYAIGTHPDADHIGGMDVILYKFDVGKVFLPDIESDTATYRDVVDTCKQKRYKIRHPKAGTSYKLGAAKFTILSPSKAYADSNDNSIVVRLEYKDTSFLFMGDASETVEKDLMDAGVTLKSDVIKLGHHGSRYSSSKKFLKAVGADYAVISCGEDNSYGHPHKQVMKYLKALGIKQYRTDKQGTIVVNSDGKKLTWEKKPSKDYSYGTFDSSKNTSGKGSQTTGTNTNASKNSDGSQTKDTGFGTYILNTNTHKFHSPSCSSVEDMAARNKKAVDWTREECIKEGYDPCKRCNP